MEKSAYTVKELAQRWQTSERIIREQVATGQIPRMNCFAGGTIRISAQVVEMLETTGLNDTGMSIFERNKMEKEIDKLKQEKRELEEKLKKMVSIAME